MTPDTALTSPVAVTSSRALGRTTDRALDIALCAAILCAAFGIVYWRSLTFVYVDGDDAEVVAYHAMGRQGWLQPIYSPYLSMFDAVLAVLPPNQDVVLTAGLALTAFATPILFVLIILLAFDVCKELLVIPKWPVVAIMLLAVPEFFYLGIVMIAAPSIVAMTLLVASHLLLRRSRWWSDVRRRRYAWWLSAILFGFGATMRWDTALYSGTVAADLVFGRNGGERQEGLLARLRGAVFWGVSALGTWLACLYFNGYDPSAVLRILSWARPLEPLSWTYGLSRIHTLFTPAFALCVIVGLVVLFRKKHWFGIIVLVAIAMASPKSLMLYGVPRWVISAFPALIAVATVGVSILWQRPRARLALIAIALLPWLLGVRMTQEGVAWGPAFEIQSYTSLPEASTWPTVVYGAGTAVPTPEGPRPLFGHAWVLGGEWRPFVSDYWLEQKKAVETAIRLGLPVLIHDNSQGWGVDVYLGLGFTGTDSAYRTVDNGLVFERHWSRADGAASTMLTLVRPDDVFEPAAIERLKQTSGDAVVIVAFTSTLAKLHKLAPRSLSQLGKTTAVFHLGRFITAAREAKQL